MVLDKELITNYYRSLMVSYEKTIDNEKNKLKEIKSKYVCYLCGDNHKNALDTECFYVDPIENKIICKDCREGFKDREFKEVRWSQ